MTGYAYSEAVKLPGLQAIEISTQITKDGVLVCSHDANLLRTTGRNVVIGDVDWADISNLLVGAAGTLTPSQPARGLTK